MIIREIFFLDCDSLVCYKGLALTLVISVSSGSLALRILITLNKSVTSYASSSVFSKNSQERSIRHAKEKKSRAGSANDKV